jgi:hypothetical protein
VADLRTTTPETDTGRALVAVVLCFTGGLGDSGADRKFSAADGLCCHRLRRAARVTQTFSGRAFVLGAAYAGTLFIGWPLIGMIGLGLADAVLGIRQAYWNRRGPPPLPSA